MKKSIKKDEQKIEAPAYTALSVQRSGSAWQVVEYIISNNMVTETIKLGEPSFRQDALNKFRVEAAKRFMGDAV